MNLQGKCFKDAFTYFQIKPSFSLYIMIARPWAESRIFNTKIQREFTCNQQKELVQISSWSMALLDPLC